MSDSAVDCLKQAREVETEENHALERKKTILAALEIDEEATHEEVRDQNRC